MCGPEEWPSCRGDPADRIRLIGPAANYFRPGPSLRSGFRLAAQTPPQRLNLQVRLPILLRFQILVDERRGRRRGLRKFQLTPKEKRVRNNVRAQAERCKTLDRANRT